MGEEQRRNQDGACGYRTWDWVAHPANTERVHLDQAFAWNPSITGTKVEETGIAGADGVEIITSSPAWPKLTVKLNGREFASPDLLSL